jgi:hypothetical protein
MNHQDTKAPREPIAKETDKVASKIVDAAFAVHTTLGPGLLESVYEVCLLHESGLRLDLVVENRVVAELKAVDTLLPVHKAQMLTYLKLSGHRLGLLVNFNSVLIKDGIHRIAL